MLAFFGEKPKRNSKVEEYVKYVCYLLTLLSFLDVFQKFSAYLYSVWLYMLGHYCELLHKFAFETQSHINMHCNRLFCLVNSIVISGRSLMVSCLFSIL